VSDPLDCKSLKCPMPIVRISQRIRRIATGDVFSVEASDPAFHADLVAWTQTTGHRLVSFKEEGSVQYAEIEKVGV